MGESLWLLPVLAHQGSSGHMCGAAPGPRTRAAHLEDPTAMCPLPLAPLCTAHERVVAGVPEGRHEVVALSIGVHFELGHGRLHLED